MSNLAFASIAELKRMLAHKEISREELLDFFLKRFEAFDGTIGSALELFDKKSVLGRTNKDGMLSGIPCIVKDTICQRDRGITCASKILEGFVSPYDATAV